MGVISVGASLGVADKAALRAPSVSPSAAAASTASSSVNGAHASHFHGASSAAATAQPPYHHNHHHARRHHEYANHHHSHYSNTGNSNPQHPPGGGGSGRNKRGGRRKYVPNNGAPPPMTSASVATSVAAMNHTMPLAFPPPPIVTSAAAASAMGMAMPIPSATTPSPVTKNARIGRNAPVFMPTAVPSVASSSVAHRPQAMVMPPTAAVTPAPPSSHVERFVSFQTNVEPVQLAPFVLGAKGGSRLQAFIAQSKCMIVHRPLLSSRAQLLPEETLIRVQPSNGAVNPQPRSDFRMSFTFTADSVKKVEHGIRLLHGAIETAELILVRKKSPGAVMATGPAPRAVAVDSGGNIQPSSGHTSASSAAMTDHSIDSPLPPPAASSSASSSERPVGPVQPAMDAAGPSIASSSSQSVGSNDERKAQTRIRYPPTNQPLARGPGLAPSRSVDESVAAPTSAAAAMATMPKATVGKKRQLPTSGDESTGRSGESKRRDRGSSVQHQSAAHTEEQKEEEQFSSGLVAHETPQENEESHADHADPDFDEFRIRVTRGIEFARRVDAQAALVSRRMVQEKQKYLRMLAKARDVQHQQRVADVVIRTQCAIMATTDGNNRKRRRIEQLSAAQEAMEKSVAAIKPPRIQAPVAKRRVIQQPIPHGIRGLRPETTTQFQDLLTKLAAFKALISKKKTQKVEAKESASDAVAAPGATEKPASTASAEEEKRPANAAAEEHEYAAPEPSRPEATAFRSRYLAPGVLRDLNLIQDYTDESECALLRLLTGQRQYFYLEPITLSFGVENLDQLQHEAVRSEHDLHVLREFVGKNRRYGADLVQQVGSVASNTQALATSKAVCWTAMQQSLVELHPLLLGAHLLALHYHAVAVLQQQRHNDEGAEPENLLASNAEKDELSPDLFKFVLRPIRSAAIESSLHDTLPISLVRETIAHCPEVVNHVLDWKEERDVPPELLQDVASVQQLQPPQPPSGASATSHRKTSTSSATSSTSAVASSSQSALLSSLLTQLQRHVGEFDHVLSDLARHVQDGSRSGGKGIVGDKVVLLVNQLKTVAARVLVVNTQLQLHKWTTVFVERGYTWFGEDSLDEDDSDLDIHGDDRSYDKFTCLQDALAVWHNEKLVYSTREHGDNSGGDTERETRASRKASRDQEEGEPDFGEPQQEPDELVDLRRVTPPDVMELVEAEFTNQQAVAKYALSSDAIGQVRREFNESLVSMRASMKILGRTAPWRTHLKHSNALKAEYAKQRELETKLLLHQWAGYYKTQPLPEFPEEASKADESMSGEDDKKKDGDADADSEEKPVETRERDGSVDVVLEPGDTPEVVDMKLLRHEIEQVAKQMQAMAPPSASEAEEAHRKKLLDACNLLASSCVSVLSKFLDRDEPSGVEASPSLGPRQRARANSTSKVDSATTREAKDAAAPSKGQTPAKQAKQVNARAKTVTSSASDERAATASVPETVETTPRASRRGEGPVLPANSKRTKKAVTPAASATKPVQRRPRAHSTSSAPRVPSLTSGSQTGGANAVPVPSANTTAVAPAAVAEPLRMGCSGCRDTRRRCTGCHGCCLHCVCLGCGCRMCCSSRMAVVQKTVSLLVTAVETRMGCKWLELDSDMEHSSERCGHVKACSLCQQCVLHCTCHPSAQASHRSSSLFEGPPSSRTTSVSTASASATASPAPAPATAGFPTTSSRKERRFRINPTAAQRRQAASAAADSPSDSQSSTGGRSRRPSSADVTPTKRTRRSNSDATPSLFQRHDSSSTDTSTSTFTTDFLSSDAMSGSSTDGMAFVMGAPPPPAPQPAQHKNEQEDLFRAARVRMKLQRNTFLKTASTHPFGLIPPNTLIEGEMLWQPDRIRLMWERKDVYGVLGVPRDATPQLIKKQYRKLVLKLHPDKVTSDSPAMVGPGQTQNQVQPGQDTTSSSCSMDDRVAAFVAVTKAYKLLSGEIGAIHNNGWKPSAV